MAKEAWLATVVDIPLADKLAEAMEEVRPRRVRFTTLVDACSQPRNLSAGYSSGDYQQPESKRGGKV